MNANLASIMPQVLGVWCEEEGHDVTFACYTGFENLIDELPDNVDVVFIEPTLKKAPLIKMVPMLGSLGCPYTCSFCIDSVVPYQPLDFEVMKEDLTFLLTKFKRPLVGWHDPNFGVRFDDYMNAIEEAAP